MTQIDRLTREQKRALLARALGGDRAARTAITGPVSFAQERMWFLESLDPGRATYTMPFAQRLRGAVRVDLLQRAVDDVVARHAVLRTTFDAAGGVPVQRVVESVAVGVRVVRVADEAAAHRFVAEAAARPFDLARGPLLRVTLVEYAVDEHILLIVLHHLVGDAASYVVLLDELSRCYRAHLDGAEPALPELPIQYADYAAWQRDQLRGAELDRQLDYWTGRLAGAPPVLELPGDLPRPAVASGLGAVYQQDVGVALGDAFRALCRDAEVTLFMGLLAVYQVVLSRYAAATEVVVGTPVSGRGRAETHPLIGLFVNTLALRTSLAGDPTFRQLLDQVRETTLDGLTYQELPFEKLVEALAPQRSLAQAPVCQVQLVFQSGEPPQLDLPGVRASPLLVDTGTAKVDLTLYTEARPAGDLALVLEYRADLFTEEWAARFLDCVETVLAAVVADPATRITDLPLLSGARLAEALPGAEQPVTAPGLPPVDGPGAPATVLELLRRRGRGPQTDDYLARAARVGAALRQRGVGPETTVGLCLSRGPDTVVGLLGIWFAGGQYVPLDPQFPAARLAGMATDADLRHLVTETGLADLAHRIGPTARHLYLDEPLDGPLDGSPADGPTDDHASLAEPVPVPGTAAAYTIFTSGSTGRPKGVTVPHRAVVNLIESFAATLSLTEADCLVAVTTVSFDIAVLELLLPLRQGARLVVATARQAADPDELRELLRTTGATAMQATPATWQMLRDTGGVPDGVRLRLCGGEALPPDLAAALSGPGVELWNVYGPTETTVWSAAGLVVPGAPVVIGPPIAATRCYVLDDRLRPVPLGVPGELYIGGAGVARGYHGRPGLTADRFRPDPYGAAGERMYATGDRARQRPDGTLELLGRADHQVKIRGFRVELGEIEAVLTEHAAISQAAAAIVDGHLTGYVVPAAGSAADPPADPGPRVDPGPPVDAEVEVGELPEGVLDHLRQRLPEHMIPVAFVVLPSLPRTPNGKLDRARLPRPGRRRSAATTAPRTPVEAELLEIWTELLRPTGPIGVDDSFFVLGGHSMTVTKLIARITAEYGVQLPVRDVFATPTITGLAARLVAAPGYRGRLAVSRPPDPTTGPVASAGVDSAVAGGVAAARDLDDLDDEELEELLRVAIEARQRRRSAAAVQPTRYPASFGQRQMWFMEQLAPGDGVYHMAATVALRGRLDLPAFTRSVDRLVARHEALRTRFVLVDGEPVQVVEPAARVAVPVVDVADDAEAVRRQTELVRRPFALDRAPALRLLLIRRAADDHRLTLVAHHAILDEASWSILLRDLGEYYRAEVSAAEPRLPALRHGFGRYARWQRDPVRAAHRETDLAYWTRRLHGAPELLDLPTDRPRPATQTFRGGSVSLSLPTSDAAVMSAAWRRAGVTPFHALLTGFAAVLARYSQQDDLVIGTAMTNRGADFADVIGMFVATVPLRIDLSGDPTLERALGTVRDECVSALDHADIPFDQLTARLRPRRSPSFPPVFQVMFVYNEPIGGGARISWPDLTLTPQAPPTGPARYDLTLLMWSDPVGLAGRLDYNADLFDTATMQRLARHVTEVLQTLATDPRRRLWELPLHAESARVARHDFPETDLVPALIEAQAARTPQHPAVIDGDTVVSYAELLHRARAAAGWLRAQGAGPETRIGLSMLAGADALTALVGVLLAGAAYVPLDPRDPRRADLLSDAGVLLDLTALPALPAAVAGSALPAAVPPAPQSAAYVIYTSGSSGRSKGVVVSHAAARNLTLAFRDRHGFGPQDRILMIPPLSFDASVGDILPALVSGAALVLHPEPAGLTGPGLLRFCAANGVTTVDAPSALWQRWAEDLTGAGEPVPGCLRRMMVGGEPVPMSRLRDWASASAGQVRFYNHYGPTEATVCATTYTTVSGAELPPAATELPIGTPLPNVYAYVLDRRGRPTPPGVPGELCLGGAGVARGYHQRPALTAAAFVPDPFAAEPGARMYRTGDIARWTNDGQLEFLGRADHQVKIRGRRIELGEIEATLADHPGVRQVAVLAPHDVHGQRFLAAYLAGAITDTPAGVAALRAELARRLPDYLVPQSYTFLDELPLTRHGKVDRSRLPEPTPPARPQLVPPTTATERRVAGIWSQALGVDPIGGQDNFLDLGGHSLLAASVLAQINESCGVALPLLALFETATLTELAARIDGRHDATSSRPALPDLVAEAVLPADFPERAGAGRVPRSAPRRVLLTGATGFLGAFLANELLTRTAADLVCLVRAGSVDEGRTRIADTLRRYQLWRPEYADRIVPVRGDLAAPRLGLADPDYARIVDEIDTIYHNGGAVNFLHPYQRLRPANVAGTVAVLRIAAEGQGIPVHYVSTLGVYLGDQYQHRTVTELDPPTDPVGLSSGYNQSKWVADTLVRAARDRGLPVTVHRPARITGDSRTGAGNPDDYFSALLKCCVEVGCVPDLAESTDMSPVDYVAGAIVTLAGQGVDGHYYNDRTITYPQIAAELGVDLVPYPRWRELARAGVRDGTVTAFAPYVAALPEQASQPRQPFFSCATTEQVAARAGVHCPPADRALLRAYLDHFRRTGFLEVTSR